MLEPDAVGVCRVTRYSGFRIAVVDPASTETPCRLYSAVVLDTPDTFAELSFPWLTPVDRRNTPKHALDVMRERIDRDTAIYVHRIQTYLENADDVQRSLV